MIFGAPRWIKGRRGSSIMTTCLADLGGQKLKFDPRRPHFGPGCDWDAQRRQSGGPMGPKERRSRLLSLLTSSSSMKFVREKPVPLSRWDHDSRHACPFINLCAGIIYPTSTEWVYRMYKYVRAYILMNIPYIRQASANRRCVWGRLLFSQMATPSAAGTSKEKNLTVQRRLAAKYSVIISVVAIAVVVVVMVQE